MNEVQCRNLHSAASVNIKPTYFNLIGHQTLRLMSII